VADKNVVGIWGLAPLYVEHNNETLIWIKFCESSSHGDT